MRQRLVELDGRFGVIWSRVLRELRLALGFRHMKPVATAAKIAWMVGLEPHRGLYELWKASGPEIHEMSYEEWLANHEGEPFEVWNEARARVVRRYYRLAEKA